MRSGEAKNKDDSIFQFCEQESLARSFGERKVSCAERGRGRLLGCLLPNPCAVMLRGAAGASLVAARERKRASKTAKHGGASRASVARAVRQPFTAEAHAQLLRLHAAGRQARTLLLGGSSCHA